ncbi:MAG: hypothetical protein V4675_10975 [Verrucomicrobiota bacterium]
MGKFLRQNEQIQQTELWVPSAQLPNGPKDGFYSRRQKVLQGGGGTL